MLFSSLTFLLVFLPLTLIVYLALKLDTLSVTLIVAVPEDIATILPLLTVATFLLLLSQTKL